MKKRNRSRSLPAVKTVFLPSAALVVSLLLAAKTGSPQPPQQPATKTPQTGEVKVNSKDGLKYVWIPPGTFMMGCSPGDSECGDVEKPSHQVSIT